MSKSGSGAGRPGEIRYAGSPDAPLTWLPRAANAAAAGLGAAWLLTHLYGHPPLPRPWSRLVSRCVGLLVPLVGSLATAIALGSVGLGGAFPAVVAQLGSSWWQRAFFAAVGFCLLIGVSRPHTRISTGCRSRSLRTTRHGLAAIGVWALAAAVQPLLRARQVSAARDLLLCAVWSAAIVIGAEVSRRRAPRRCGGGSAGGDADRRLAATLDAC